MNRIDKKLNDEGKLLSIYFTAGYPSLNDTQDIIIKLEESGVDMIEIGLPFSDPLADGPIIQDSSTQAIKNGMNSNLLFDQLKNIRSKVSIPLIIMGYFNPIYQYKFNLKPRLQFKLISIMPYLRNFLTSAMYYTVK